jgi:N-acetylglutamate synthase-like GNAT family acetyltransferase
MKSQKPIVEIRRAVEEDVFHIESLLQAAFSEYQSLYTPEGFAATTPKSRQLKDRLTEGPIWVAVRKDSIVGTVSAVPLDRALYIRSMAVSPEARGQGIGSLLLMQVESFASDNGLHSLYLSTTPFLSSAIQLYEAFGFRRSDDGPDNLHGTPLFTMVKRDIRSTPKRRLDAEKRTRELS